MGDHQQMQKVDLASDKIKLSQSQLDYMKILEKQNFDRVAKIKRLRTRNIVTGLTLFFGVTSIYSYSIWAVKQEKFLDEIDDSPSK